MVFKTLTSFPKGQKCQLCLTAKVDPEALGNICQTADVIVHYFCLLLASKIQQKGTDKQGLLGFFSRDIKKEIKRGSTIVCNYCKKNGATVMCSRENCHLNFHVPCAQQKGSLHQYFNEFKSFCDKHKPRQKIPASLKKRRDLECVLCCSPIKFNVRSHEDDPIWPTCCKPQALLHKRCLQHFATSSGYYFKCPFCSNKEEFHKGMKTFGIYIPEQEASWETEPNAYRELLERDVSCDAGRCRCPRGRVYSVRNSKWYLEVCILCGASGQHRGCMLENIMTETYECDVCAKVNKQYPNSEASEDIPEPSPLSDRGECNETVPQSVEGNISKNLSLECEDIIVISDSESENNEVEVIGEIPPPTVTKNVRKRQLSVRQEKRSGLKRQRLAEGGAETSSEMCFTIDEESRSSLSQAMDNSSLRTDELENNPRTCETNFPNAESINERIDTGPVLEGSGALMIQKVCTLSDCDQTEIDQLSAGISNANEVHNNQSRIGYVDLVSDNESDQVMVISDTDSQSGASSLLDSDSSLLDFSEIPESEKSLFFENFSQPKNYAKEFPTRTQIQKKRRKKKKRATPKKKKTSVKTTPTKSKSNTKSDETFSSENINTSSNQRNLESTSSSEVANTNTPSSSLLVNGNSSEDESFRGFCSEETQSNNESVGISTPIQVDGSMQTNKTFSNDEKVIDSAQHMSGNHIFLSTVDDTSKCYKLDNLNLINKVKNIRCQVTDLDVNTQPKCVDNNTVKTISNSVVLKLLAKDDKNCNKSVSNNCEPSKCKNNNYTNVTVTSLQELSSNKSSTDAVICSTDLSELSRNTINISECKIDANKDEVTEAPHEAEYISEKETLKIKTKPVIEKSKKSKYPSKTKRAYKNNNKPKILCSLALKQPFGDLSYSLSNLNKAQHHKNKSGNNTSSETDLSPIVDDDRKINYQRQFISSKISSNEVGSRIWSPKKYGLPLELHSPKSCTEVFLESHSSGNCSKGHGELESSMHSADLTLKSKSSENVSEIAPVASTPCTSHAEIDLQSSKSACGSSIELILTETDSESQIFNKHSELHRNSLLEKPSVLNTSPTQIELQNSEYNLEIRIESGGSSQSEIKSVSSERISEFPKKSESSKLNSEFSNLLKDEENLKIININAEENVDIFQSLVNSPVQEFQICKLDSTETTHEADVGSQVITAHSEPNQNSLLEKHIVITSSQTQIELKNSESSLEIQMKTKRSSKSEIEPVAPKCISEFPKKSDTSVDFSNLLVDEENLKLDSCKLKPTKSLEVSKNCHKITPNIKKHKPPKIRGHKEKPKDQCRKKISFQTKASKTNNYENLAEFSHAFKQLKQKEQVHTVLPSSDPNPSQEQLVSETHEFYYDSVVHMKSNVCVKPEDSAEQNASIKVSNVHSCIDTKYPCDEPQVYPRLDKANTRKKLNTTLMTTDENKLSIEIENNLKGSDDSVTIISEKCCIRNQDHKNIENEMDENKVYCRSRDFEKQMSIEDSKVHSNIETNDPCNESQVFYDAPLDEELGKCFKNQLLPNAQENLKTPVTITEENKPSSQIENNLKDADDSITLNGEICCITNQDHKNIKNEMDENKVNCASRDFEITKHDWYKICTTDCPTCHNSVTLRAKHNIMMNDSIYICFYCKDKINDTSLNTTNSQVPSACSCQENENNFSVNYCSVEQHHENLNSLVFNGSKLSKDNSLIGSDLNSNYKSNNSLEKQKSPFKDCLKIGCKEINTLEANSSLNLSDVLSPDRKNMATELEQGPSIQAIPDSIENSLYSSGVAGSDATLSSEKRDPEITKSNLVANMNNDESTETLNQSTIRQIFDKIDDDNNEKRVHELRHYYKEVFNVRIILKEVNGFNNDSPSLMSHVETFWVHNRKYLRELLKVRYFSENDKKLVIYTDVCGFRYARLFLENIPDKIDPRVVFETGGDIPYYLQKLIKCQETETVISPRIVLIVYGNTLIPDKNVFHLLQLASNLNNIKLVVTTVLSQKPRILKFNRKLIDYSKRFGYHVWDITKIHFRTDIVER